jgi:hypothetical protein
MGKERGAGRARALSTIVKLHVLHLYELLPKNKHNQSDVVVEPSWLVPTLQTQGGLALLVVMVKQLYNKTSYT